MAEPDADQELELVDLTDVDLGDLAGIDDEYLNASLRRIVDDADSRQDAAVVAGYSPPADEMPGRDDWSDWAVE